MKTVTICGSMRFAKKMQEIAWELETQYGMNVLQCVYHPPGTVISQRELTAITAAHYWKIDLSDAVYVADIGGYIGNAVQQEIDYATVNGKQVIYHSQMHRTCSETEKRHV